MANRPTKLARWASVPIVNATTGLNNVLEPLESKKDLGWDFDELALRNYQNWIDFTNYSWLNYMQEHLDPFSVIEQPVPDMTIQVTSGVFRSEENTITEIAIQSSGAITAPSSDPRIDLIALDESGIVQVITGAEAGSPVVPDIVNSEYIPLATILLQTTTTTISNDSVVSATNANIDAVKVNRMNTVSKYGDVLTGNYGIGDVGAFTTTNFPGRALSSINISGTILHIKDTTLSPRAIIEGANPRLDLINTSGGADVKWMQLLATVGITKFTSLTDAGATNKDNILVMDHTTGNVGINVLPASPFHVRTATNKNLEIRDNGGLSISAFNDARSAFVNLVIDTPQLTIASGVIIVNTTNSGVGLDLVSTNSSALAGPTLSLWRNSSNKADNDLIGNVIFRGEDSNGALHTYAEIGSQILDTSNGTEDGRLIFKTSVAGTLTNTLILDTGRVGFNINPVTHRQHIHEASSGQCFTQYTNTTTGTAAGDGFRIGLESNESVSLWNSENSDIQFATSDIERLSISSDGGIYTNNATGGSQGVDTFNAKGYFVDGVLFEVTTSGSWTPTILDNSLSAGEGQTYDRQEGRWQRIGDTIHFWGEISIGNFGTLTTSQAARIGGLPVISTSDSSVPRGGMACTRGLGLSITAGNSITGTIETNSQVIQINQWGISTGNQTVLLSQITVNGDLVFNGSYTV